MSQGISADEVRDFSHPGTAGRALGSRSGRLGVDQGPHPVGAIREETVDA